MANLYSSVNEKKIRQMRDDEGYIEENEEDDDDGEIFVEKEDSEVERLQNNITLNNNEKSNCDI